MRLGTNATRRHVDEHAPAVTWLECCRYSLNPKQSINQSIMNMFNVQLCSLSALQQPNMMYGVFFWGESQVTIHI